MHHLSQWENITPIFAHGPITDPFIDIEPNLDQIINLEHFNNQSLKDVLKNILIREYLKNPVII